MDGQKSFEIGRSGSENLLLDDEVFHQLSPLDFRYPESSSINFDLDANYLLDIMPDPLVASESGILTGQAGEFGLPDQELTTQNALPLPDQGTPEAGFSSFLTSEMTSSNILDQEISRISFSNFLSQEMNYLDVTSHNLSSTSFLKISTQELNSLSFSGQGLSMVDPFNFPTQKLCLNTLELHNQGLSMMDTFGLPAQEALMNPLEIPNPGLPMTDTLGLQTQELFMNTSGVPYQPQPVFMTMDDNVGTTEIITISSSDDEQLQEGFNPNYGNDNGANGSNSNLPLRQTLSKEMISQYFHMPINGVATTLNIGVTVLKIRCRELVFSRWPQRKLTSIQAIITHLQEFGESSGIMIEGNVQERIIRLENERRRIEDTPDLLLEDDTIRLRQAIYKSSHTKRKRSDRDH